MTGARVRNEGGYCRAVRRLQWLISKFPIVKVVHVAQACRCDIFTVYKWLDGTSEPLPVYQELILRFVANFHESYLREAHDQKEAYEEFMKNPPVLHLGRRARKRLHQVDRIDIVG